MGYGPLGVVSSSRRLCQMSQFSIVGARLGERILPEPVGQDGGLGPGRPRNVQVCFGVIGRRSP